MPIELFRCQPRSLVDDLPDVVKLLFWNPVRRPGDRNGCNRCYMPIKNRSCDAMHSRQSLGAIDSEATLANLVQFLPKRAF